MDKNILQKLIDSGLSTHGIAKVTAKSQTCVRYWLKQHGLKTHKATDEPVYLCKSCGETNPVNFVSKGNGRAVCQGVRFVTTS